MTRFLPPTFGLALVFLFVAALRADASPIRIDVLSTQYETTLNFRTVAYLGPDANELPICETHDIQRTRQGPNPITDSQSTGAVECVGGGSVVATADLFTASANAAENDSYESATADTSITFSPAANTTGTIGISFNWEVQGTCCISGSAGLRDLTIGEQLWGFGLSGTGPEKNGAAFAESTTLSADHVYQLDLGAFAGGWLFGQAMYVRVSGLEEAQAVPDSGSTLLLFGIGLGGIAGFRRSQVVKFSKRSEPRLQRSAVRR
jgi:hypothetical protein